MIDVDVHGVNGYAAYARAARAGLIPEPLAVVRTPTGGQHAYFPADPNQGQRSWQAGKVGIDCRGDGGYIIAPPSLLRLDGVRTPYRIEQIAAGAARPINASRLRDFLNPRPAPRPRPGGPVRREDAERLATWLGRQATDRNLKLFWASCRLAEGGVPLTAALDAMVTAAQSDFGERELTRTVYSAYRSVGAGARRDRPAGLRLRASSLAGTRSGGRPPRGGCYEGATRTLVGGHHLGRRDRVHRRRRVLVVVHVPGRPRPPLRDRRRAGMGVAADRRRRDRGLHGRRRRPRRRAGGVVSVGVAGRRCRGVGDGELAARGGRGRRRRARPARGRGRCRAAGRVAGDHASDRRADPRHRTPPLLRSSCHRRSSRSPPSHRARRHLSTRHLRRQTTSLRTRTAVRIVGRSRQSCASRTGRTRPSPGTWACIPRRWVAGCLVLTSPMRRTPPGRSPRWKEP